MKCYPTYSLDTSNHIVSVKNAVKGRRYYCPSCGEEMIPKQGKIRQWHFAHKVNNKNCSYETYLHKLAKQLICESFNNSPQFIITYHPKTACAVEDCPIGVKIPCKWYTEKSFDLKQYYNKCKKEVQIGDFKADLLLSNTNDNFPPILIEIWVSHKSSINKIQSKFRIIEIRIESEADIYNIISTHSICEDHERRVLHLKEKISFYNFKDELPEIPKFDNQHRKYSFWLDSNGEYNYDDSSCSRCLTTDPYRIQNAKFLIQSPYKINEEFATYKIIESDLKETYCLMCRHFHFAGPSYKMYNFTKHYGCLLKHKSINILEAKTCPNFDYKPLLFNSMSSDQECKISIK